MSLDIKLHFSSVRSLLQQLNYTSSVPFIPDVELGGVIDFSSSHVYACPKEILDMNERQILKNKSAFADHVKGPLLDKLTNQVISCELHSWKNNLGFLNVATMKQDFEYVIGKKAMKTLALILKEWNKYYQKNRAVLHVDMSSVTVELLRTLTVYIKVLQKRLHLLDKNVVAKVVSSIAALFENNLPSGKDIPKFIPLLHNFLFSSSSDSEAIRQSYRDSLSACLTGRKTDNIVAGVSDILPVGISMGVTNMYHAMRLNHHLSKLFDASFFEEVNNDMSNNISI